MDLKSYKNGDESWSLMIWVTLKNLNRLKCNLVIQAQMPAMIYYTNHMVSLLVKLTAIFPRSLSSLLYGSKFFVLLTLFFFPFWNMHEVWGLLFFYCRLCSLNSTCWPFTIDRGCFCIPNQEKRTINGLVAHLSSKACMKVHDASRALPRMLSVDILPKFDYGPKVSSIHPPMNMKGIMLIILLLISL